MPKAKASAPTFSCIICYEEIDLKDLVVCANCHSAYHRDCLKLAYVDRTSRLYHCCSYCTLKMSTLTLIKLGEIQYRDIFNILISEKAGLIIKSLNKVNSIIKQISDSYLPHEQTYAMLCWYMTKKQFDEPERCEGMETFI